MLHLSKFNTIKHVGLALIITTFTACGLSDGKKKESKEAEIENFELDENLMDDIETAKKIFYSLPSPLETAVIIKNAGAEYNEEFLNSTGNTDKYTTNRSMALNLGIYTTDMSFASLFDQTQTTINYMNSAKKLADGLGILDAIDENTITRLEANINNRNEIMNIISETFMNSSSYLKEYDRAPVATVVLVGGWIEGLYVATQFVTEENFKDNEIVNRIVEQKLSWEILGKLLEQHKADEDIAAIAEILQPLNKVFKSIIVKSQSHGVESSIDSLPAVIKSDIKIEITYEQFQQLTKEVKSLRDNFIS